MWGQAGLMVGGMLLQDQMNQNSAEKAQGFAASQADANAREMRAARKEAPDDALNYFNKIAPESSQSERLGVSGSAVGQAMSAPTQGAIARDTARTAQNKLRTDVSMQKNALIGQTANQGMQMLNQNAIAKRNNKTALTQSAMEHGASPEQALNFGNTATSGGSEAESDAFMKTQTPKIQSSIRNQDRAGIAQTINAMIKSDELTLQQKKELREWATTPASRLPAFFASGITNGDGINKHLQSITNDIKKNSKYKQILLEGLNNEK